MKPQSSGSPLLEMAVMVVVVTMAVVVGPVRGHMTSSYDSCPISVATFNPALTPLVHDYENRKSRVQEAIKASDAHVICLQEVWFEEDMQNIVKGVKDSFPHHYSPIHEGIDDLKEINIGVWNALGESTKPCATGKMLSLNLCFGWNCMRLDSEKHQSCMVKECSEEILALSDECRSCISVASTGPLMLWKKCVNLATGHYRVNPPGLLILSKKKLASAKYVKYHNGTLVERGYIEAKVENGPTVVCTHLTAVFDEFREIDEELKKFKNYATMQAAEITMLAKAFSGTDHILLGDLNTGPKSASRNLTGEAADNYKTLVDDLDYRNPYLRIKGRGQCTYCHDNEVLVAENNTHYGDLAIDQVLLSPDFPGDIHDAKRVFDKKGAGLSDHYGVQLDLDPCFIP